MRRDTATRQSAFACLLLLIWALGAARALANEKLFSDVLDKYEQRKFSQGLKLLSKEGKRLKKAGETPSFHFHMLACRGYNGEGEYDLAAQAARAALELADSQRDLLTAHNGLAVSLFAEGTADDLQMREAEEHFRLALEASGGRSNVVRLGLAKALIYLYNEAEATELLEAILRDAPGSSYAKQAQRLIEDPMRATHVAAPSLAFDNVVGGGQTTLEDLRGKVVLLDFWATWCKPCEAAIPKLQELSERLQDQPFELVSISVDKDPEVLKAFIGEHQMSWMQGWDDRGHNARVYGVSVYPSYVLLGPEGELLWRGEGWNEQVEIAIRFEVDRALAAVERKAEEQER